MREVKFRAWHKKYKKMYEVSSLHMATLMNGGIWATVNGYDCIEDKDIKIQIQPKDIELMQYTGLKDRNGREIYEGDILEGTSYLYGHQLHNGKQFDFKGIVEWGTQCDVGLCWILSNERGSWDLKQTVHRNNIDFSTGIILGNIYENPELIHYIK